MSEGMFSKQEGLILSAFGKWWSTQAPNYAELTGVLQAGFRELAFRAWTAGVESTAATDLLEACKALANQEDWQGEDIEPNSPVGRARAAIAKAEREKP